MIPAPPNLARTTVRVAAAAIGLVCALGCAAAEPFPAPAPAPPGKQGAKRVRAKATPETEGYTAVVVVDALFAVENVGMIAHERAATAHELAAYVATTLGARVRGDTPDRQPVALARRALALALHLDPRSRGAHAVNNALARGGAPPRIQPEYRPDVFAQILATRAGLLYDRGTAIDTALADYFLDLAVAIASPDAKPDDWSAKLDSRGGSPDWVLLDAG